MKITINKTVSEAIEIPEFFEKNGRFCKVLNDDYYMSVNPQEVDVALELTPNIQVFPFKYYLFTGGLTPISEAQFDLAFLKTETILNKLRKS